MLICINLRSSLIRVDSLLNDSLPKTEEDSDEYPKGTLFAKSGPVALRGVLEEKNN